MKTSRPEERCSNKQFDLEAYVSFGFFNLDECDSVLFFSDQVLEKLDTCDLI